MCGVHYCHIIEAPWLVNGGHSASLRHHKQLGHTRTVMRLRALSQMLSYAELVEHAATHGSHGMAAPMAILPSALGVAQPGGEGMYM
jgi:hypothetical protein